MKTKRISLGTIIVLSLVALLFILGSVKVYNINNAAEDTVAECETYKYPPCDGLSDAEVGRYIYEDQN